MNMSNKANVVPGLCCVFLFLITTPGDCQNRQAAERVKLIGSDFSSWRAGAGDWQMAGEVFMPAENPKRLGWKPGVGVIVNGTAGRTKNLLSKQEHGDVRAHVEFMVPQGSNSGVYFQSRYEIQVFDSWGVAAPKHSDCGGIYQRWDENRDPKGYEGRPPRENASRPPGVWQSYDVIFQAPRFDAQGKKIANAKFVKVYHNGVLVHENQEVTGPTRAATYGDEKPMGPLMLQGDHGPVAYRNIWWAPIESDPFLAYGDGRVRITDQGLGLFRGDTGDWQVVGDAAAKADNAKLLTSKIGRGAILNGAKGKAKNLVTKMEFGDVRAHIEFMMAQDSNSGVYFGGQYEVQIFDSWQKKGAYAGIECGGIYQRWDEKRNPKGFEGHSPQVNASFSPGKWQAFDVIFRAARFDTAGKKTAPAEFVKIWHNGKLIHQDVKLYGPTRGSMYVEERATGPLLFQGDHGPVAYRNVWVAPMETPFFFSFESATGGKGLNPNQRAELLKKLGYDGMEYNGFDGLAEIVQALDDHGLRLFTIYTPVNLDEGQPKYDPKLQETLEIIKDRDVVLELHVHSTKYKKSDPAGDGRAVGILQEMADLAATKGVRLAIYPHYGFWGETVEDSIRVAEKVNRPNVGSIFNLCHWLRAGGKDYESALAKAKPTLIAVSINGAETNGTDWKALIQPLGRGGYDNYSLLKAVKKAGFQGGIGLQTYGVSGPPQEHLGQSMKAWQAMARRLVYELDK
jgi:sugar phosphate isomerase/epimerase